MSKGVFYCYFFSVKFNAISESALKLIVIFRVFFLFYRTRASLLRIFALEKVENSRKTNLKAAFLLVYNSWILLDSSTRGNLRKSNKTPNIVYFWGVLARD
jgi:hypothetical protein